MMAVKPTQFSVWLLLSTFVSVHLWVHNVIELLFLAAVHPVLPALHVCQHTCAHETDMSRLVVWR